MKKPKVICVHIGARAHYLIPIALEEQGCLHTLITDTWISNRWIRIILSVIPITSIRSLAGRYTPAIPNKHVRAFSFTSLVFELKLRARYSYNWTSTLLRDAFFEQQAVSIFNSCIDANLVLGISYTALESFKRAKSKGMRTVLFQVDPGLEEEHLVANLLAKHTQVKTDWERAPKFYWDKWKEECTYADAIIVNSQWSKEGLIKQGVASNKISIIPLPYVLHEKHYKFNRIFPKQFNSTQPLRCLFLGTLALRKGIHLVLEAAQELVGQPIEFIFVGRSEIDVDFSTRTNCTYKGIVSREAADTSYQQADVFLFPTLSDGFGLTQLEAMAWQLPVIATSNCGAVVEHETNGWVIEQESKAALIHVLLKILTEPQLLQQCATKCLSRVQQFNEKQFSTALHQVL